MKIISFIILLFCILIFIFQIYFIHSNFYLNQLAAVFTSSKSVDNKIITLNEADNMKDSKNENFWLNSGALFYFKDNYGYTIQGDLPKYSTWRLMYKISNPLDTDDGYHPQNILRLITKKTGKDSIESFYTLIVKDNLSQSPNRNESNGVFAILHYTDSDNLYYAGIRVDGTAVIKKKKNGVYYTLAQKPIFSGDIYDKNINPNLLPKNQWVGIKAEIKNIDENTIEINLYLDKNDSGDWIKILSTTDKGDQAEVGIIKDGYGGIRSDFMDIEIRDYSFESETYP